MIQPKKVYFLQHLVMFHHGSLPAEKIRKELEEIGFNKDPDSATAELQREADRLGHRINVSEVLAHAHA